jgi:stress response protein YsnF
MANTVIGIFENWTNAQNAGRILLNNGFSNSDIDISTREGEQNENKVRHDDNSVSGFFNNLFGDNDESRNYSTVAKNHTVLTVHCSSDEEANRVARILDDNGAIDVNERAKQYNSGNYSRPTGSDRSTTSSESIPIIEESMDVGKREVESGKVRLRSRIINKPVEKHLRLRSEHIDIERNRVNRPASEADLKNFKEGTIEATETREEPMVRKEARVVEEVKLNKRVEHEDKTIKENVRKTDVDVEHHEEEEGFRRK